MSDKFDEAELAFDEGDLVRASELYRALVLDPDAPDYILGNFVSVESSIVRSLLRRKLRIEPDHVYARLLLASREGSTDKLRLYTELLERGDLSPQLRFRTLLHRFGLFVSKRLQYPNPAADFLEARRILAELNADGILRATFSTLARIDSPTGIPVLQEIADALADERDAVDFIMRKIDELHALAALQAGSGGDGTDDK